MIRKDEIQLIKKFFGGNVNIEEEKNVYNLFFEHANDIEFKNFVQDELQKYFDNHKRDEYDTDHIFYKVNYLINQQEAKKKKQLVKQIYYWYAKVAAIIILPILIGGYLWFNNLNVSNNNIADQFSENVIKVPMGARINFTLPDGTYGWLNSGSSLSYSLPFNDNRKVNLKGEGWFNVAHDTIHPFEIEAGKSKVEVLGTVFNLYAYPEEDFIELALEEGKVKFTPTENSTKGFEIKPNEKLLLEDGKIKISETEAYKFGAWREGNLVFRGDAMVDVAKRIERWYNVDVQIIDEELKKHSIRGTFQDDSLEEVLRFLSLISPLDYKIIDKKILNDNTITKKKVLIYKK